MGAYVAGGDPETDLAIALQSKLVEFLRQGLHENVGMAQSREQLGAIFTPPAG
ncbi:flagellum-specific ATP synthase [compost metagenome]